MIKQVVEKVAMGTAIYYRMEDGTEYLCFPNSPTSKAEVKAEKAEKAEVKAEEPEVVSTGHRDGQIKAYKKIESSRLIGLYLNEKGEIKWIDYKATQKHVTKPTYRISPTCCYSTNGLTGYVQHEDGSAETYLKGKACSTKDLAEFGQANLQGFCFETTLREQQKYVAHHYDRLLKAVL